MKHSFALFYGICFLSWICPTLAQKATKTPKAFATVGMVQRELEALKNDSAMQGASWGLMVTEASSGRSVVDFQSKLALVPASTQKLFTTAVALSVLGPNYKYATTISYDGYIDYANKVLHGNLYIKGSGDPTLLSKFFAKNEQAAENDSLDFKRFVLRALTQLGLQHISGKVIGDASIFESECISPNWVWEDLGNYFGAGTFGLNYKDNEYSVFFNTGNEGELAKVEAIEPAIPGFTLEPSVIARGTEDSAYLYGIPYINAHWANGSIPAHATHFEVRGSQPDPPLLCATELSTYLNQNGIAVDGPPASFNHKGPEALNTINGQTALAVWHSPTLLEIARIINHYSNNLFAETLLKTLAIGHANPASEDAGIAVIYHFLKEKKINCDNIELADGNGLSRKNSISCLDFVELLNAMRKEPCFNSYFESLPSPGKPGTLFNFAKGHNLKCKSIAFKSGSFKRVRSYAGYITLANGQNLTFAFIANNFNCSSAAMKRKMEKVIELVANLNDLHQ